jgi:uncharacterized surface protein with fasciclin (FAS1) repeats
VFENYGPYWEKYNYGKEIHLCNCIYYRVGYHISGSDWAFYPTPEKPKDIVDTAIDAGSFSTLVTALEAADLVDTLKGAGPFTVFAPTDDAFNALPTGVLDDLLGNVTALTEVLTYHVVSGKYMAADVVALASLTTIQGDDLAITVTGTTVQIDGATVVQTDIETSNGVIHVIDAVLIP